MKYLTVAAVFVGFFFTMWAVQPVPGTWVNDHMLVRSNATVCVVIDGDSTYGFGVTSYSSGSNGFTRDKYPTYEAARKNAPRFCQRSWVPF